MLKGRELPDPGEEITLSFQLLPFFHQYFLKAVVVWVSSSIDPDLPRGMGVRFVNLEWEDERQIQKYIEGSNFKE